MLVHSLLTGSLLDSVLRQYLHPLRGSLIMSFGSVSSWAPLGARALAHHLSKPSRCMCQRTLQVGALRKNQGVHPTLVAIVVPKNGGSKERQVCQALMEPDSNVTVIIEIAKSVAQDLYQEGDLYDERDKRIQLPRMKRPAGFRETESGRKQSRNTQNKQNRKTTISLKRRSCARCSKARRQGSRHARRNTLPCCER